MLKTPWKCTKIDNARAQLLFCSLNLLFGAVLVAVVVVVCLSSLNIFSSTPGSLLQSLTYTSLGCGCATLQLLEMHMHFNLLTTDNVARLKYTLWTSTLKLCGSELTIAFLRIDSAVGSAGISLTIANSTLIFFCIGIQNKIATEFL